MFISISGTKMAYRRSDRSSWQDGKKRVAYKNEIENESRYRGSQKLGKKSWEIYRSSVRK